MGSNQNLKAYVRYDGSNRVVAGSLIFRRKKPKVGKWHEIAISECCEYIPTSTTTTSTSSTTSTTTTGGLLPFNFGGSWSFMDRAEACAGLNADTYFSNTPYGAVGDGTQIYTNPTGTTTPPQPFIKINGVSYANTAGLLSLPSLC